MNNNNGEQLQAPDYTASLGKLEADKRKELRDLAKLISTGYIRTASGEMVRATRNDSIRLDDACRLIVELTHRLLRLEEEQEAREKLREELRNGSAPRLLVARKVTP